MSASGQPAIRTCAFGDLDAGAGGIAWAAVSGPGGAGLIGALDGAPAPETGTPQIEGSHPDEQWHLQAHGIDATFSPAGEAAQLSLPQHGIEGFHQLCQVTGRLLANGVERELDCLGQRGARSSLLEPADLDSLRELTGWFGPDEGLALVSLRRRNAVGHDHDAVNAVLFERGKTVEIAEPRLSTTYTAAGVPSRASLELWLDAAPSEDQADDAEDDGGQQFPLRAAGEAVGTPVQLEEIGAQMHALLFRWHMRGRHGAGCYLLSRPAAL